MPHRPPLRFLADTNIVSELWHRKLGARIVDRWAEHQAEIGISAVTWQELLFGAAKLPASKKRQLLEEFLVLIRQNIRIVPFEEEAARWQALERARLRTIATPPYGDTQIAATAAVNGLVLLTLDGDFRIFEGLKTESWK